jgi:hypothetical protein
VDDELRSSAANGILEDMTAVAGHLVGSSVPAICDALDRRAPDRRLQFESELREALLAAAGDLDLTRVERVLALWCARAALLADPLSPEEQSQLQRARAGDFTGLHHRGEDGTWSTL